MKHRIQFLRRRREFISLLGAAAAAWPLATRAQQPERMRRIGALMNLAADDVELQQRLAAFLQGLQEAGWEVGRNVRIDIRSAAGDIELNSKYAMELLALAPDVFLAAGAPTVRALQKVTRTVPIVFTSSADPVGAGLVASLGRPSGNATGFSSFEYSIGGKWLEFLKQIAPTVTRVAVVRDPDVPAGIGQFGAIQAVAPRVGVELRPIDTRDSSEIEQAMNAFTRQTGGGLIVTQNTSVLFHRKLIIALAARHRLPAVYASRFLVTDGGLLSYGPNLSDNYRRAAGYVDRILKAEKPADLPVQNPAKYELVINLKTAKALGIEVPPTLLAIADEVIE
jgi:putative tryptophan/tyrosine transport system substrate-binding protein